MTTDQRPISTYGLDHIHLNAPDAEATSSFYERVFGMERLQTFEIAGRHSIRLSFGNARLTITQRDPDSTGRGAALDHFAVYVDDINAAEAELRAHGVRVVTERGVNGIHDFFFVEAPDGVVIEIISPASG